MPTLEEVTEFAYDNLDKVKVSRNGTHFNARCPICGDSKKSLSKKRFHLQFNDEDDIMWHCFNCGEKGNFYSLYAELLGITNEEAFKRFNKYNSDRIEKRLNSKPKKREEQETVEKKEIFNHILKDCISLDDEPDGYIQAQYQQKLREFTVNRKIEQKLYVAYKGDYRGRIIIPVWEDDDIIYFQGRAIHDSMEPKYLNPLVNKSSVVLNRNNFDRDKYIIITEGIIDADAVGEQGTSILGKELSQDFVNVVNQYTDIGIIVVMDNDEDGIKKLYDYTKKYNTLKYFLMPTKYNVKDLNDLVSKDIINRDNIYNFIIENSYNSMKTRTKIVFENRVK